MKKIRNYMLYMVILLLPFVVHAANASANNWKMYCEDVTVEEGKTTKCYLLAQISDATDGGDNITAVLVKLKSDKASVEGYEAASSDITVTKTENGANFTGNLDHGATVCGGGLGCYDFTATAIKSNTTSAVSQVTGNTDYTPIGVWTIRPDNDFITPDSEECATICVDVNYIVGTGTNTPGVTSDLTNHNGACWQVHLSSNKICKIDNGKYYGKSGTEVTKEVFEAECNPPAKICKIENGVYYDKSGNQVTEAEWKKACTCRIENGVYYDESGAQVTKEVYEQKCTCRIENGVYYDSTGTVVTKEVYEKKCSCRQTADGKYYGKDGSPITKEQYDKDCVPPTGSFASYAVLAAGALIALSAIMIAQKHNRFYKV